MEATSALTIRWTNANLSDPQCEKNNKLFEEI